MLVVYAVSQRLLKTGLVLSLMFASNFKVKDYHVAIAPRNDVILS